MTPLKYLLLPACAALLLCTLLYAADDDTVAPAAAGATDVSPALSADQQRAVGVVIAAALAVKLPRRSDAFGRVLDPSQLVADAGRLESSRAADRAATEEATRLKGLYRGANASLKALQAAEAEQIEAQVRARQARTEFLLHWGPLARLGDAQRAALIDQVVRGSQLLLRADLPGRHILATIPRRALVDVDGIEVPARVVGLLPQAAEEVQSVGLLLQIRHPPTGLGAGAQLPVMLAGDGVDGCVVPEEALLYGEQGAYVYHVLPDRTKDGDTLFAPQSVTLVQQVDGGWLVTGLHTDDRIVVRGAGVLWSLQGLGNISDEDTD